MSDTAGHAAGFWFTGLLIVALTISSVLGRYYRRHFGTVQPQRRAKDPLLFILFVALFAAAVWAPAQRLPQLIHVEIPWRTFQEDHNSFLHQSPGTRQDEQANASRDDGIRVNPTGTPDN